MISLRLAVEQLLERRFWELSTPFRQMLDLTVVGCILSYNIPWRIIQKQHRTILISSRRQGSD